MNDDNIAMPPIFLSANGETINAGMMLFGLNCLQKIKALFWTCRQMDQKDLPSFQLSCRTTFRS